MKFKTSFISVLLIALLLINIPLGITHAQGVSEEHKAKIILKIAEKAVERARRTVDFAIAKGVDIPENISELLDEAENLLTQAENVVNTNATEAMELAKEAMRIAKTVIVEVSQLIEVSEEIAGDVLENLEELLEKINELVTEAEEEGIQIPEELEERISNVTAQIQVLIERLEAGENVTLSEIKPAVKEALTIVYKLNKVMRKAVEGVRGIVVAAERIEEHIERFAQLLDRMNVTGYEPILENVRGNLSLAVELAEEGNISEAAKALSTAAMLTRELAKLLAEKAKETAKEKVEKFAEHLEEVMEHVESMTKMAELVGTEEVKELKEVLKELLKDIKELRKTCDVKALMKIRAKILGLFKSISVTPEEMIGKEVVIKGIVLAVNDTKKKMLVWGVGMYKYIFEEYKDVFKEEEALKMRVEIKDILEEPEEFIGKVVAVTGVLRRGVHPPGKIILEQKENSIELKGTVTVSPGLIGRRVLVIGVVEIEDGEICIRIRIIIPLPPIPPVVARPRIGLWIVDYSEADVKFVGSVSEISRGCVVKVTGTVTSIVPIDQLDIPIPLIKASDVIVMPRIGPHIVLPLIGKP